MQPTPPPMPPKYEISCPQCRRKMRLVGRERDPADSGELLTFQCDCGQVIATRLQ